MVLWWLGWAYQAKTVREPQRGGVNSDLPIVFWCLFYVKYSRCFRNTPGQLSYKIKSFTLKNVFGAQAGCGDATSLYKNLVKNRKTDFRRQAIQEPIFPVANEGLKAVAIGVVAACGIFFLAG
jgi:hypothetical protein